MDAALSSNTPVTHYMEMPIWRFFDIWQAICAVQEAKAEEINAIKNRR